LSTILQVLFLGATRVLTPDALALQVMLTARCAKTRSGVALNPLLLPELFWQISGHLLDSSTLPCLQGQQVRI
jgi:hypothetical protein